MDGEAIDIVQPEAAKTSFVFEGLDIATKPARRGPETMWPTPARERRSGRSQRLNHCPRSAF
jgi:hypothetical protein